MYRLFSCISTDFDTIANFVLMRHLTEPAPYMGQVRSVWPEMGDTPINCSGSQEDAQTVMTNDGYEFPMFTDQF